MYYRRKILLATLEQFGGSLNHTNLQKLLFLITRKQEKKAFDFVPYKFGCFSFQANQDLKTMCKYELIESVVKGKSSKWVLMDKSNKYSKEIKSNDLEIIREVKKLQGSFKNQTELIRYTYLNYPFYATKSTILNKVLGKEEIKSIEKQKRELVDTKFFTIGYEGISLETYLNKLIINDVKLLCDVRKNSLSMKYGFSKTQLRNACESIGIKYLHIPELGIESSKRKELDTQNDYEILFKEYEKFTLKKNSNALQQLAELAKEHKRVAITCFEKDVCMCHRGRVLKHLTNSPKWNIPYHNL